MTLKYPSGGGLSKFAGQKEPVRSDAKTLPVGLTAKGIVPPPVQYIPARANRHFEEKLVALSRLSPQLEAE